ncbi:subtilisin-like protein [Linderina pennispora]|uniref:Subtilisin-like protein n=1 Tax=Linderina pennispora TaxID=61395 RepID=A0A1Y1VXD7_9FUNG|nr:subtilisin-like protein [Linderina pennispora]ORX65947.1 subtilisin-like protein [Linderina pennispora]
MSGNKTPHTQFPTHGLLPRADTQAGDFVRKHPHYDGRGTIVAVLDTGIAPMAMGLHTTTDGKRKVLDYVDCTGSGDVRLQAPRTNADELVGATGRKLKVNSKWKNPTGEWRVGAKRLYEITPDILKEDIKKERQAVFWLTALPRGLATSRPPKDEDAELKHELEAQREVLKDFGAKYEDPGPVLDILVFHDGKQWRAAIDTQETGDFTGVEALGAYKLTGDIGKLAKRNLFYYTLNFYEEGKVLSIVANVGSHSTHVAGIIGAHHPDEPQNDGVAPGAQLLSLMIGDHRVSSLETGTGLTRAANAIIEHGADLANMSYGEPSATANSGQWVQLLRKEVIKKHRCIFVSSAGNEGPALSTAGAPGGASDDIIGVGAYVGYEQIKAEYTMYDTVKDTVFTWSSRGPTADGSRGVDIYAPGSAITSYPTYTLQRLHLANGTSMSSPNLCGCLALLVSAWKHEFGKEGEPKVSPYRIKNAMMATAKQFGDELAGWAGAVGSGVELESQLKFEYEQRVILSTSESWIKVPEAVYVSSEGRSFDARVDPTSLERGRLHVAEILGFDSRNVDRGAIFRIPVTITKPSEVGASGCVRFPALRFQPTEVVRRFIDVPRVQLAPQTRFTQYELNTHVTIGHSTYAENGGLAEQSYTKTMKVLGGCTLEPVSRVDLVAAVRPEYGIKVTATLDTLRRALRPAVSSITPLTLERDTHPEAGTAIQQLILDYKYSTSANGVSITPRLTGIDSLIYEAWTDNVALLVFDAKKQRVGAHFGYPRPITLRRKGDYLIRVQIRHRSAKDLGGAEAVSIPVEFALASVFTKTVSNVRNSSKSIQLNNIMPVFLKTFAVNPPKDTVPGDILRGSLSASPNTADLLLEYVVPSKANEEKQPDESSTKSSSKKQGDSKKKEAEESQADKDRKAMQEAMRNLKIEWVKKAQDPDVRTELIRQLEAEQANDTQVLACAAGVAGLRAQDTAD